MRCFDRLHGVRRFGSVKVEAATRRGVERTGHSILISRGSEASNLTVQKLRRQDNFNNHLILINNIPAPAAMSQREQSRSNFSRPIPLSERDTARGQKEKEHVLACSR